MGRSRRHRLIVDPAFQLRWALTVVFFLVVYSAVLGFFIFYPLNLEMERVTDPGQRAALADQILLLHMRVWPGVLVVAILIGCQTVILSHRIAGPVYRMRVALEQIAAGDLSVRLEFRKHDRFKELAPLFNTLVERLGAQRSETEKLLSVTPSERAVSEEVRA